MVKDSDINMRISKFGSACPVTIKEPVVKSMQIQNEGNRRVENEVVTPGFVRSVTGSEMNRHGLNLKVVLSKAHVLKCGNMMGQRFSEVSDLKTLPKKGLSCSN